MLKDVHRDFLFGFILGWLACYVPQFLKQLVFQTTKEE
jgi:hypothetical protein